MANFTLGGFRPWGTFSGGESVFPRPMVQEVASGYSTQLNKFDIITQVSDGTVAQSAAADNGKLLGVVTGCSYVYQGKRVYSDFIPASTAFTPSTVGSPNASLVEFLPLTGDLIMEVDADDGVTFTTIAGMVGAIGENCDLTTSGTASTTIGLSVMCLDISTHATTTANFRIVGINGYTAEGLKLLANDPTVTRFKFLVVCNEGLLPPYTATGV